MSDPSQPELTIEKVQADEATEPRAAVTVDHSAVAADGMCLGCKKAPIEYMTAGCHHRVFCRRCAMKCATGGKCKICGTLYPDLVRCS